MGWAAAATCSCVLADPLTPLYSLQELDNAHRRVADQVTALPQQVFPAADRGCWVIDLLTGRK